MASAVDPLIGKSLLGKLRVRRLLGRGGMGTVYEVEDVETGRPSALKVLHSRHPTEEARARFRQEAEAAARIQAAHVVQTLDAGELDDGSPFLLMELLEGQTLAALLSSAGRIAPERAATIVAGAARGAAAVHAAGLVHRDLKPQNLFLTRAADGTELVKLLDFGVSKVLTGDGAYPTRPGSMLGTLPYMSPEQIRTPEDVDPRADVYSLGVVLYELLCGEPPYRAPTEFELLGKIVRGEHRRLSATAAFDTALDAVVERAIHVDRAARWQSALELHAALVPFQTPRLAPQGPGDAAGDLTTLPLREPEPSAAASAPTNATRPSSAGSRARRPIVATAVGAAVAVTAFVLGRAPSDVAAPSAGTPVSAVPRTAPTDPPAIGERAEVVARPTPPIPSSQSARAAASAPDRRTEARPASASPQALKTTLTAASAPRPADEQKPRPAATILDTKNPYTPE